jgi:hypothetical protein
MNNFKCLLVIVGTSFLAACASEKNLDLADNFWQQKNQKIVVAKNVAPRPALTRVGAEGILDMAINMQMTKPITTSLEKTDMSWYPNLQSSFVKKLQARGISARAYTTDLDVSKLTGSDKDINQYPAVNYAEVISPLNANKVMVLKLNTLGATRRYSGFIPLGAPQAYCSITGELIDQKDQHLLWRYKATVTIPVKGEWDQPPAYGNLKNALQVAIATAQDEVLNNFFSGH